MLTDAAAYDLMILV